jgi:hypothetical protein
MSTAPDDYQPPPSFKWEHRAVFRETFLFNLTQPGAADALRHLQRVLYDPVPDSCEHQPDARAELRAAVADLFHLQGFIASVWAESEVAAVPAADLQLCKQALHWSRRAARLAREIEAALGELPEPEPGGGVP